MWLIPILTGIVWAWLRLKRGKVLRLPVVYHRHSWAGLVLDLFVILILVITAIVAFAAPPNSNEAMVSRMSRVAHWTQNQSVAHYATGIESQNSNSPGADMVYLHFFILSGSDQVINLVSWLGFAGSAAAAASLAEVLGAKMNGQRMAAIFTATLPVAITQATGATNEIVVTLWIVSAILMALYFTKVSKRPLHLILAALAAGLAVVTKPTAFIFLWPFALYLVVILHKQLGMRKVLMWAGVALLIAGSINGGHFFRNQHTYGQFYRPAELTVQMNDVRNWRVMVSNITRNAALHADLPFPRAENWLLASLQQLHEGLDLDLSDARTTSGGVFAIPEVNTSEMTSGNPLHAAIIIFSITALVGMVLLGKEDPDILAYIGANFFSLVLFCYFLKWQPTGSRLQLPFFVLFAPLLGVFFDWIEKFGLETLIAMLLLLYAMPWLFQTQERPVIADPLRTFPVSVFKQRDEALYFVTNPEDEALYHGIADELAEAGVRRIGLDLTPTSEEYPFWKLLGAPAVNVEIEWIMTETASSIYLRENFSPEAIICEDCSQEKIARYARNFIRLQFKSFDLFIKEQ